MNWIANTCLFRHTNTLRQPLNLGKLQLPLRKRDPLLKLCGSLLLLAQSGGRKTRWHSLLTRLFLSRTTRDRCHSVTHINNGPAAFALALWTNNPGPILHYLHTSQSIQPRNIYMYSALSDHFRTFRGVPFRNATIFPTVSPKKHCMPSVSYRQTASLLTS